MVYNMSMRLLVAMVVLPMAAFGVTVEPLPISDYADTEVSTNIPFEVSFDAMSRMNFSISLEAWNLVKVTRRGKGEVCELATVEGAKPGAALIVR